MYQSGTNGYQAIEVDSMSPARSIVFLYGFIIGQLNQAKHHLVENNPEARSRSLDKAREAVNELLVSLNRTDGGEIAANLASLYAYFLKEILHIDLHQDTVRLDRLHALVSSLHEAWVEAEKSYEQQAPTPTLSANA